QKQKYKQVGVKQHSGPSLFQVESGVVKRGVKLPHFIQVGLVVVLGQQVVVPAQLLQDPGVDPLAMVAVVFVVVQVTDQVKVVVEGIQLDVGNFQQHLNGQRFGV